MFLIVAVALLPLLDDRPPVEDLERFPPACVVEEQLRANRLYREHMEYRMMIENHQYWALNAVFVETRELYEVWDALRWAQLYSLPSSRRDMLKTLRELLGPEAYYAGAMPPCVPVHRFIPRN